MASRKKGTRNDDDDDDDEFGEEFTNLMDMVSLNGEAPIPPLVVKEFLKIPKANRKCFGP